MKIVVDPELCQGHNRCLSYAGELLDLDSRGCAVVLGDGTVPAELVEDAQLAVDNCPEEAISTIESA
ncbi:MAG TPA: ferredoxin [Pseudonocardiaceae bacterium]